MYTSVQDLGRSGVAHLGVPQSGAIDRLAHNLANALLNNSLEAATIEYTLMGPTIRFESDAHFVLTGSGAKAQLEGKKLHNNIVNKASAGQVLIIGALTDGSRGYLGIAGGINTKKILGSYSQFFPLTKVNTIQSGVSLTIGKSSYNPSLGSRIGRLVVEKTKGELLIPVVTGPEFHLLSEYSVERLWQQPFTISKYWNRMATQLKELMPNTLSTILTGPVLPGTVQLTPLGKLIVLMADCQTTGGYPRILQLQQQSIQKIAQLEEGDQFKFVRLN